MVDILLSTYNGEKFLVEQLESVFAQSFQDFTLVVRDDGSTDATLEMLEEFVLKYPQRIRVLDDGLGNLGSSASFMKLLEFSDAKYMMFCDQDDVWMSDKVEVTLLEMLRLDVGDATEMPLLVFSDLKVVDSSLNIMADSFWEYQKMTPDIAHEWKKLLAQNVVTGCTMMINQKAKECSLPFALKMMVHDQWIGVNVAKYGRVSYIDTKTILYRQHDNNVEGANSYGYRFILQKLKKITKIYANYVKFAHHFKDISARELLVEKFVINLKRIIS